MDGCRGRCRDGQLERDGKMIGDQFRDGVMTDGGMDGEIRNGAIPR